MNIDTSDKPAKALTLTSQRVGIAELVQTFLAARFSGAEQHCRRLAKVAALENAPTTKTL